MTHDKIHYLSQESFDNLNKEFAELKNIRIPEIANRIDEAKQQGDLSENAEYHQAKEDMAWARGRLIVLEQLINNSEIIQQPTSSDIVSIGQKILVEIKDNKKEFIIVGPQDADPANGKISNESPLGEAFIGHKVGDAVEVKTPAGIQNYKILEIQ